MNNIIINEFQISNKNKWTEKKKKRFDCSDYRIQASRIDDCQRDSSSYNVLSLTNQELALDYQWRSRLIEFTKNDSEDSIPEMMSIWETTQMMATKHIGLA